MANSQNQPFFTRRFLHLRHFGITNAGFAVFGESVTVSQREVAQL
jgi:hypothetical protein